MTIHSIIMQSDFIHPLWFNRYKGGIHPATVENGLINLDGEIFKFKTAPTPLLDGTEVFVWLNGSGFFVCETVADQEARKARHQEEQAKQLEAERQTRNQWRAKAEAVNATIKLPVLWSVAIKDVLSGLSETSWGDGRNKATVNHIYLKQDLSLGRLKRSAGDFLCSTSSLKNGKRYAGQPEDSTARDGDGNAYQPEVTCKACLAIIQRINSKVLKV